MATKVTYSCLTPHPKFHRSCSKASRLAICTYTRCSRSAPGQVLFRRFRTNVDLRSIIYPSALVVQYISTPCANHYLPFYSLSLPAMRRWPGCSAFFALQQVRESSSSARAHGGVRIELIAPNCWIIGPPRSTLIKMARYLEGSCLLVAPPRTTATVPFNTEVYAKLTLADGVFAYDSDWVDCFQIREDGSLGSFGHYRVFVGSAAEVFIRQGSYPNAAKRPYPL